MTSCDRLAKDRLLDTYHEERAPHVRAIIARAVKAGCIIQTTDHVVAESRDRMFLAAENKEVTIEGAGGLELKMPSLTSGVFDAQSPGIVGGIFRQPLGEFAGREVRLDDLYGGRFVVVGGRDAERLFTPDVREAWAELGAWFVQVSRGDAACSPFPWPVMHEDGDQLSAWLDVHGAAVVRAGPLRVRCRGLGRGFGAAGGIAAGEAQRDRQAWSSSVLAFSSSFSAARSRSFLSPTSGSCAASIR